MHASARLGRLTAAGWGTRQRPRRPRPPGPPSASLPPFPFPPPPFPFPPLPPPLSPFFCCLRRSRSRRRPRKRDSPIFRLCRLDRRGPTVCCRPGAARAGRRRVCQRDGICQRCRVCRQWRCRLARIASFQRGGMGRRPGTTGAGARAAAGRRRPRTERDRRRDGAVEHAGSAGICAQALRAGSHRGRRPHRLAGGVWGAPGWRGGKGNGMEGGCLSMGLGAARGRGVGAAVHKRR